MRRHLPLALAPLTALALLVGAPGPATALGTAHPAVVSDDPVDTTPHVLDGAVRAVAVVGSRVYVGGSFSSVRDAGSGTTAVARTHLFAYDRATGRVVPGFAPRLDGPVETLAASPDGSSVVVGGRFRTVDGAAQRSLAVLTATGARDTTFRAATNGIVRKVLVRGERLVLGGRFTKVGGTARANLAVVHARTGALDTSFAVPVTEGRVKSGTATKPSVEEMDADAAGSRLVVVGNFRRVGGQVRQQIAMVDLAAGSVTGWRTDRYPNDVAGSAMAYQCYQVFDTQMRDVEFAPDGRWFAVVTTGGAPDRNRRSLCDTTTRWETAQRLSPAQPEVETWRNCTGGDTLYSVAVSGSAVYVGGHQRWLDNCGGQDFAVAGSFAAPGIGAIHPATGLAIRSWNPGRTRGVGAEELVTDSRGLHVGSDTERLGGEYHARLGFFPLG